MRVLPVQAQLVDPVSSLLIPTLLLSSLQLFLPNIGQHRLQPSSTVSLCFLFLMCVCSGCRRPAFAIRSKVPTNCLSLGLKGVPTEARAKRWLFQASPCSSCSTAGGVTLPQSPRVREGGRRGRKPTIDHCFIFLKPDYLQHICVLIVGVLKMH